MSSEVNGWVRVWDAFVRVGHWLVVVGFFVAYFTEDDLLSAHVWAGYLVGAIVLLRIVWGFVSPKYARFADFAYGPAKSVRYLVELVRGRAQRYVGHSPAGGAMVIMLLVSLTATVVSGLTLYAYDRGAGPLAPLLLSETTQGRTESIGAGARVAGPRSDDEELWEEIHEFSANLTLALVILHVVGVLLASYVHHENLARAMVTGYKREATPRD